MNAYDAAKAGYALYRGSRRKDEPLPLHWDDLDEKFIEALVTVATVVMNMVPATPKDHTT